MGHPANWVPLNHPSICRRALGCADWFTARVATLGELEAAMKTARDNKSGSSANDWTCRPSSHSHTAGWKTCTAMRRNAAAFEARHPK
jgi:hypothetical protein